MDYEKLCKDAFEIDSQIRYTGIINNKGELVTGGHRNGTQSILSDDEIQMSFHYTIKNWENLQNLAHKMGGERSSIIEYDKVTIISIPFNQRELFMISTEPDSDYIKIISKVRDLIEPQ